MLNLDGLITTLQASLPNVQDISGGWGPTRGETSCTYYDHPSFGTVRVHWSSGPSAGDNTAAAAIVAAYTQATSDAAVVTQTQALAKSLYDDTSYQGRVLRALTASIVNELNLLRGDFVSLSALQTAIAGAPNTLAGMKAAIAGLTPLAARTAAQVRTVVRNDIDSGA